MFVKLSLRNAKRQLKDYVVYIITITITVSLIYAFNALMFSEEVKMLVSMKKGIIIVISFSSALIAFIIGWLINYTIKFMLNKRSREMGTYMLLGIEQETVANIFFYENITVGLLALAAGLFIGGFIYQILRAITMSIFLIPYQFQFRFSIGGVVLTCFYFAFIYFLFVFKIRKSVSDMKIYDLLYFEKKNEEVIVQNSQKRKRLFISSAITAIIGLIFYFLAFLGGGSAAYLIGCIFLVYSIYSFFISIASYLNFYYEKNPYKKYKREKLFIYRSLASKVNTMSFSFANITVLITITLTVTGAGIVFSNIFKVREEFSSSYDFHMVADEIEEFQQFEDYINNEINIVDNHQYHIYQRDSSVITKYLIGKNHKMYDVLDRYMLYSDYVYLRNMLLLEPIEMNDNEFIVHCYEGVSTDLITYFEKNREFTVENQVFQYKEVRDENFTQYFSYGNGNLFIIVVPDYMEKFLTIDYALYAGMTNEPVSRLHYDNLKEIEKESGEYYYISTRAVIEEEQRTQILLFVFPLYYLALVLTMVITTILTIQLISDINDYKYRYKMLHYLGMDESNMKGTLKKQMFIYYFMPIMPACIISTVSLVLMMLSMDAGVIQGVLHMLSILGLAYGLFFFVYLCYIIGAYFTFKRNVFES